ncbi:MAG: NUDIX hydrolase [Mycobacterium sp.]|uniref:NUDIX hydrolase n=1 Tax=Mycobacterium sp. TaxID=1785 RepID=UPI00261F75AC|nr:NUDIX hydrolase [Mycobacterium sp.]MDI3313258.1 NUDIX hydrolase [Mycobacterium sp.]
MSDGEKAQPRRRRSRRRRRRAGDATASRVDSQTAGGVTEVTGKAQKRRARRFSRGPERLRTLHEISAGGLVVDGIDRPRKEQLAVVIGRVDRRGRMLWSLPKGHIEVGETAEQTAIREVAEETGIRGRVLAALGRIDYWFVTNGRRVHKTVHHYLMQCSGGELCEEDLEVAEVAWVPLEELPSRLAYADERRLAEVADELIDKLQTYGPAALPPLPPSTPRRRPQTHSRSRQYLGLTAPGRKSRRGPSP